METGPATFKRQFQGIIRTTPTASLLEREDDSKLWQRELENTQKVLTYETHTARLFSLMRDAGFSDKIFRMYLLMLYGGSELTAADVWQTVQGVHAMGSISSQISSTIRAIDSFPKLYLDEDHEVMVQLLEEDPQASAIELLREKRRSTGERLSLLQIQLQYLRKIDRQQKALKGQQSQAKPVKQDSLTSPIAKPSNLSLETVMPISETIPETPFLLQGWQVAWTDKRFSLVSQHLVPLDTSCRKSFIAQLSALTRGEVAISLDCLCRALEFYLRKDVLQKALAARLSYVPKEIKDWVKIKRGGDRIFMQLTGPEQLVFFAAGRDVAYRNLRRL